ncbi:MAG: polysaccharide deacetylase family protein [Bacteroidetes bacterium]|nr:polysaccharide deacetylase family protein [Bacteroidota bacterium]
MFYFVKTPLPIIKTMPWFVWRMSRKEKLVYLTFDDGPTLDITPWVLETLENYNAKATFFCLGENIRQHPEIFENIKQQGHAVGNHTYHHLNGWKTPKQEYVADVSLFETMFKAKMFRPPYGKMTPGQVKNLKKKYKLIMWDVISGDFDLKVSPEKCLANVTENTQNGSIVVFHDSKNAEAKLRYALPKALETLSDRGYTFASLKEFDR